MQPVYRNMFIPANRPIVNPISPNAGGRQQSGGMAGSFGDVLAEKTAEQEKLQFSKHAEMRLKSRDITLSDNQMQRAAEGVSRAKVKGIKDSLVLVDNVALVVNTKSNTVITALENNNENIFTNIDGAVIV